MPEYMLHGTQEAQQACLLCMCYLLYADCPSCTAEYPPNLPMSRQSSLTGTYKCTSLKLPVPSTILTHLPRPLAGAESILPKHTSAMIEGANASFAPGAQSSSSHSAQHALDTSLMRQRSTLTCMRSPNLTAPLSPLSSLMVLLC